MNLAIFSILIVIGILLLFGLISFLFYKFLLFNLNLKIKSSKETLINHFNFWSKVDDDFLFNLYLKINKNFNDDNYKKIIISLKESFSWYIDKLDYLSTNLSNLSFLYAKKIMNNILNSKNSILSISKSLIKNININICLLNNIEKQKITKRIKNEMLNRFPGYLEENLYQVLIYKEGIKLLNKLLSVFLDKNDKFYKSFKQKINELNDIKNFNELQLKFSKILELLSQVNNNDNNYLNLTKLNKNIYVTNITLLKELIN